jgi:hypothetical protein
VVAHLPRPEYGCDRVGGEPVRAGWVVIVLGATLALVVGNPDAVVAGVGLILLGFWLLSVKEEVR